jgi:hypothetical protein
MLRSAFAHNMLMPRWNVRGPYADLSFNIDLGKSKISGNFSSLDGQIFSEKHLGGFRHILRLIDAGTILISKIKKA